MSSDGGGTRSVVAASGAGEGPAPVVVCRGLGKAYRMYRRPHDRLLEIMGMGVRHEDFWAVRGVDLDIRRGESVGVLGRNGAGKSTLLQLICGTLRATEGTVERVGRISPLLELGSGFNPEFTGRENVDLCATILGLRADEVRDRFDDIVAFADIGAFLDQPVKFYSSGMRARLAFSVAVHVDPSILILDEILSVGDAAFQRRCYARLRSMKDRGVTILFVSHAPNAVVELCDRAVLIEAGELLITGDAKPVAQWYQKLIHANPRDTERVRDEIRLANRDGAARVSRAAAGDPTPGVVVPSPASVRAPSATSTAGVESFLPAMRPKSTVAYNSNGASIHNARIENESGAQVNVLERGRVYRWCYEAVFDQPCHGVRFGMLLKAVNGVELFATASAEPGEEAVRIEAGSRVTVCFRFRASLTRGTYFLNCGVMGRPVSEAGGVGTVEDETYLARIMDAAMFRVDTPREPLTGGHVDLRPADLGANPAVEITTPGPVGLEGAPR